MGLFELSVFVRVVSPIVLSWLAWVVGRAPTQVHTNRLFATFLGLLAFGFGAEFLWDFLTPAAPDLGRILRGIQLLAGLLDPPVLLAYALAFPRVRRALRSRTVWILYGAAAAGLWLWGLSFLSPHRMLDNPEYILYGLLQIVYVNGTYLAAFVLLVHGYAREDRRYLSRQLAFVCVGVGFAALSRSAAVFLFTVRAWFLGPDQTWYNPTLPSLALSLLVLGLVAVLFRGAATPDGKPVSGLLRLLALLLTAFFIGWIGVWFLSFSLGVSGLLFSYFYSLRWIFVALVVGYGILRFQLFDFELRTRQAVRILASMGTALLVAIGTGLWGRGGGSDLMEARWLGLAVAAVTAAPLYWAVGRALSFAWPEPSGTDAVGARRLEIYEATLEYALLRPDWSEEERRFVETLREVFEISPTEHELVVARLRRRQAAKRSPGATA